jgi:hypothetical protein
VVWFESAGLPLVSPLACLDAAMLKGRAVRGFERVMVWRMEVLRARREDGRKADMVVGLLCGLLIWLLDC